MTMIDTLHVPATDVMASDRAALVKALDMDALWRSCSTLISKALPCHSCSLMFDIDGFEPQRGWHHLAESRDSGAQLVTSLDVAAPYLDANPQIPWYTFSQIASQDAQAAERLKAQNPTAGWREFIHLAFWDDVRLEAVLSIRILARHTALSERELTFLMDLYTLLDASLQRIRTLELDRARNQTFEALLYGLPIATVFVDENLAPSYMSQEARRICQHWRDDLESEAHLPRAIEAPLRVQMQGLPGGLENKLSCHVEHPRGAVPRLHLEISPAMHASSGRVYYLLILAPEVATQAALDASESPWLKKLSPSERKVATLVAAGMRNEAIAQKLCRSRKTVESQISSIFRKLDVDNRTQLARLLS